MLNKHECQLPSEETDNAEMKPSNSACNTDHAFYSQNINLENITLRKLALDLWLEYIIYACFIHENWNDCYYFQGRPQCNIIY